MVKRVKTLKRRKTRKNHKGGMLNFLRSKEQSATEVYTPKSALSFSATVKNMLKATDWRYRRKVAKLPKNVKSVLLPYLEYRCCYQEINENGKDTGKYKKEDELEQNLTSRILDPIGAKHRCKLDWRSGNTSSNCSSNNIAFLRALEDNRALYPREYEGDESGPTWQEFSYFYKDGVTWQDFSSNVEKFKQDVDRQIEELLKTDIPLSEELLEGKKLSKKMIAMTESEYKDIHKEITNIRKRESLHGGYKRKKSTKRNTRRNKRRKTKRKTKRR